MTVYELIALLNNVKNKNKVVMLSTDEEGNHFSHVNDVEEDGNDVVIWPE